MLFIKGNQEASKYDNSDSGPSNPSIVTISASSLAALLSEVRKFEGEPKILKEKEENRNGAVEIVQQQMEFQVFVVHYVSCMYIDSENNIQLTFPFQKILGNRQW